MAFLFYGYGNEHYDPLKNSKNDYNDDKKMDSNFVPQEISKREGLITNKMLRRNIEIEQIFTVFTALTLNILPYFASDYPDANKSEYYRLFC